MQTPAPTTIYQTLNQGDTYLIMVELIKLREERLRISITSEEHAGDCKATCEVFSHTEKVWNPLLEIHYSNMHTPRHLRWADAHLQDFHSFKIDRTEMVRQALGILFH